MPPTATSEPRDLAELALDAFYVTVGLGVIAVQNLDGQRRVAAERLDQLVADARARLEDLPDLKLPEIAFPELSLPELKLPEIKRPEWSLGTFETPSFDREKLSAAVDALNERFDQSQQQLDDRLSELEARLDTVLDRFEDTLPDAAREMMAQARGAAKDARGQLRTFVGRAA